MLKSAILILVERQRWPQQNFPQIPSAVWWKVRNAFKKTVPARLTDTYLASVLNVKPNAARIYLRDFQSIGLADEKGTPTELAYAWRDDEKYSEATEKMLNKIYPDELRAAAPGPAPDRKQVTSWLMHDQRLGEGAASNKAAFYSLLASGELPAEGAKKKKKSAQVVRSMQKQKQPSLEPPKNPVREDSPPPRAQIEPNIQLNIQIHISAEATKDQIDAIFASMATHLRR